MRSSHHGPLMPVAVRRPIHPVSMARPGSAICLGFQLANGKPIGPRDMFDDPAFDEARRQANQIADILRQHGPFEPHPFAPEEMEYTTMPQIMKKVSGRMTEL